LIGEAALREQERVELRRGRPVARRREVDVRTWSEHVEQESGVVDDAELVRERRFHHAEVDDPETLEPVVVRGLDVEEHDRVTQEWPDRSGRRVEARRRPAPDVGVLVGSWRLVRDVAAESPAVGGHLGSGVADGEPVERDGFGVRHLDVDPVVLVDRVVASGRVLVREELVEHRDLRAARAGELHGEAQAVVVEREDR